MSALPEGTISADKIEAGTIHILPLRRQPGKSVFQLSVGESKIADGLRALGGTKNPWQIIGESGVKEYVLKPGPQTDLMKGEELTRYIEAEELEAIPSWDTLKHTGAKGDADRYLWLSIRQVLQMKAKEFFEKKESDPEVSWQFSVCGPMTLNYNGEAIKFYGGETYLVVDARQTYTEPDKDGSVQHGLVLEFRSIDAMPNNASKLLLKAQNVTRIFGKEPLAKLMQFAGKVRAHKNWEEVFASIEMRTQAEKYKNTEVEFGSW